MNKTIIITRTSEYGSYEDFNCAINNRENCSYNNKSNLKSYLAAREKWQASHLKKEEGSCIICLNDLDTYRILFQREPSSAWGDGVDDLPYDAIKEIMSSNPPTNKHLPYASFCVEQDWEVILVLCNEIGIKTKEEVEAVDLFLDCICKDVGITKGENVMYIHAEQIGFYEDGILVDNHKTRNCNGEKRVFKWINNQTENFIRIAYFVHEYSQNKIFGRNIVNKDFLGWTKLDDYNNMSLSKSLENYL